MKILITIVVLIGMYALGYLCDRVARRIEKHPQVFGSSDLK